nr:MAG TPA: hypothetical protein [Caudoviricetes sp.]
MAMPSSIVLHSGNLLYIFRSFSLQWCYVLILAFFLENIVS